MLILLLSSNRWTNQRKAFGKPLNSQAVIRSKLAAMIARVESGQTWLENITHQMNNMVSLIYLAMVDNLNLNALFL